MEHYFLALISPENPDFYVPAMHPVLQKERGALQQMGSITARKKADSSTSYKAQSRLKEKGVIVHSETETFTRKALVQAWIKRREADLQGARAAGTLKAVKVTVGELLDDDARQAKGITKWGRSKCEQQGHHGLVRAARADAAQWLKDQGMAEIYNAKL